MKAELLVFPVLALIALFADPSSSIRLPDRTPAFTASDDRRPLKTAVFALGCFWRSEAVFGCLPGVVRTTVGYSGGSALNPTYKRIRDHAEVVQVEYDPKIVQFRQLLDVFWTSHDPTEVFGQGPDVGDRYRSIIFTNGTGETRMAAVSKEKQQAKIRSNIVTTQIQELGMFYAAETEHQKFELKHNPQLFQLLGFMPAEELQRSSLAMKLNSYAAELCPPDVQSRIDAKINNILDKEWPVLKDI
ncbi:Peptide methionine sulfoxide reductase A5 [Acorus calamus]|uniref:Peptide methionine sulfoxide reductase A5 n=1 Tax=Acorus calamus TaxID=4465 RepID=A0AAV9DBB9_ACOCL|nr:Peptide methionine sulfoxide reductase A5 [Acorus calamus]